MDVAGPLPDELWNLTFLTDVYVHLLSRFDFPGLGLVLSVVLFSVSCLICRICICSSRCNFFLFIFWFLIVLEFNHRLLCCRNLGQNYLTGRIPASIGNLTRMQYLYATSFLSIFSSSVFFFFFYDYRKFVILYFQEPWHKRIIRGAS